MVLTGVVIDSGTVVGLSRGTRVQGQSGLHSDTLSKAQSGKREEGRRREGRGVGERNKFRVRLDGERCWIPRPSAWLCLFRTPV